MQISTMLISYTRKLAALNPLSIAVQFLVTMPAIGAITTAAIISYFAPSASGLNTIPRMATEFVYEKTQTPASTKNHIVFSRCADPAPEEKIPKPVSTCNNVVTEEVPIETVAVAFGNFALIGYVIAWLIGLMMFGVYKMILPSLANIIIPRGLFIR